MNKTWWIRYLRKINIDKSIEKSFIEYALTDGNDKKLKSERDKKLYHKAKTLFRRSSTWKQNKPTKKVDLMWIVFREYHKEFIKYKTQ